MEAGGVFRLVLLQRADAFHRRSDGPILFQIDEDAQVSDGGGVEPLHGHFHAFVAMRLADPFESVHATKIVVVDLVQLADDLVPDSGWSDEAGNFARTEEIHAVPLVGAVSAGHATTRVDVLVGEALLQRPVDEEERHQAIRDVMP
jgi:hypothetical protein